MNIPNIPTDNLYKFIALTGVVLFLISTFYPDYQEDKIKEDIIIFNGEVQKLNLESSNEKRKLKYIKEKVEKLEKEADCDCSSIINDVVIQRTRVLDGPKELLELSNQIDELVEEYLEINKDLELKAIDISVAREKIDFKENNLLELRELSDSLNSVSLFLTVIGFLLWYNKTQKHQDRTQKEQSESSQNSDLCQSCGLNFKNQLNYTSSRKSEQIYCETCFKDGEFTEPELTIEQMRERIKNRCTELKINRLYRFILIERLDNLKRWRKKFTWK